MHIQEHEEIILSKKFSLTHWSDPQICICGAKLGKNL
jgi:hypothetical protein